MKRRNPKRPFDGWDQEFIFDDQGVPIGWHNKPTESDPWEADRIRRETEHLDIQARLLGRPGFLLDPQDSVPLSVKDDARRVSDMQRLPRATEPNVRVDLERLGFKFIGPDPRDNLFSQWEFPDGWKLARGRDYRHQILFDDKGRQRGDFTFKPEHYDRYASGLHLWRRYDTGWDVSRNVERGLPVEDKSTQPETVLHTVPYIKRPDDYDNKAEKAARKQAEVWLDEQYPDWRDRLAYWD